MTTSGVVAGTVGTGVGGTTGFLWRNRQFTILGVGASWVSITGMNDSGDVVGSIGTTGMVPFFWYHDQPAPTRFFPFDTAVSAVDINNRREVLLLPRSEYYPGASVWRAGEFRSLATDVPLTPRRLSDNGLVIVSSRGTLRNAWWFVASPFSPSAKVPARDGRCPAGEQANIVYAARGRVMTSVMDGGNEKLLGIDDGLVCRDVSKLMPGFDVRGFNDSGWYWGFIGTEAAIGRQGKYVTLKQLVSRIYEPVFDATEVVAVSESGIVLAKGKKLSGFNAGKAGLIMLRPL